MRRLIVQILSNILAIWLAVYLIPGITWNNKWQTLVIAGVILGLANFILKPILSLLSLPLIILSLGLFSVIINVALLYLAAYLVPGFNIQNLLAAVLGTLLISIVNIVISFLFKKRK